MGMASDVHSAVPYSGIGNNNTANLVQLLREAEEGKGLDLDYSDALGEALGPSCNVGDSIPRAIAQQQKGVKKSLALLGRVPTVGRKRSSRVIAGFLNGEELKEAEPRPQQHRQKNQHRNHFHGGTLQQPGTAPSDVGLIPESLQASKSSTTPSPEDEKERNERKSSGVGFNFKESSHGNLTKPTTSGGQPLQQRQQQRRQNQQQLEYSGRTRGIGSPSPPCVAERPGDIVGALGDEGGNAINAVSDDDIRRVYATLKNRPQWHSDNHEGKPPSGAPFEAEKQGERQPQASGLPLRGFDGSRDKTSPEINATGGYIFGANHIGSTPSFPTGAPVSPTRRSMVSRTTSLAQAHLETPVEEDITRTVHIEKPRTTTPDGIPAKRSTPSNDTRGGANEQRVAGAPPLGPAEDDLATMARKQEPENTRKPPPQAAVSAVRPVEPAAIKLAVGLGSWADETAAVGRLVDQDSRRIADERAGEAREEGEIRRTLERGMGRAVKSLPLSFLKDFGYLGEAQKSGLEKTTRIMERMAAVARLRAWRKWRDLAQPHHSAESTAPDSSLCAAAARGYLARRRVAEMRRQRDQAVAQRTDHKRSLLHRRLVKVSAASRVVASCLVANAAARRQERLRLTRAAVAKVERSYIARKARQQGWREIVVYRKEHAAAGIIQRWTRGVLVRRRTPLDRRIRRMEQTDARFAIREEVLVAHLVDHGAAVIIQNWWRTLPWRMRRLRMKYRHQLGLRATVIQRAYRRRLLRLGPERNGKDILVTGGKAATAVFASVLGVGTGGGGRDSTKHLARLTGTVKTTLGQASGVSRLTGRAAGLALNGVSRSTMVLRITAAGRARPPSLMRKAAERAGQSNTAGSFTQRISFMTGTIRRAGASTHETARKTMAIVSSPMKVLLNRKKQKAATTVAGVMMMRVAAIKLQKTKKERERKAAEKIQKFVRDCKHNVKIGRRRDLFRAVCIQAMYRATAKGKAGLVVRALGRRYIARRRFRQTRRWAVWLQALVRGWIGRRKAQSRRTYVQRLGEERAMGLVRWVQLARRREEEELVNGARSEDLDDELELQRTFMKYCRFGDRRNTGRMVVAKLTALCKDSGIIDQRFPVQRVEISFSRLKPKDLSHLPYSSFLAALDDIAIQHPDVRKLADAAAAAALEERVAIMAVVPERSLVARCPGGGPVRNPGSRPGTSSGTDPNSGVPAGRDSPGAFSPISHGRSLMVAGGTQIRAGNARSGTRGDDVAASPATVSSRGGKTGARAVPKAGTNNAVVPSAEALDVETAHGFRPDDQRLLVLLQKFVLVKSQAGKEACSELDAERSGASYRALSRLEAAAVIVQSRVARGCAGRELARKASERREIVRHRAKLNWAASLLQTRVRAFAARTRVSKMAVKRYYRCLDGLTGAEYYFDPRTGKSWWNKPKILGRFDIPTAVVVPAGEEIMVPMCHECADEVATEICVDCDEDMLCDPCADRLHRTGNTTGHLRVPIDMCEECSFQVAVKHCKQCGDNFCVSCFAYLHRKGRLRRHTCEPLVVMCHDCGERAQAFRCFGCEPEGQLLLCKPCLEARHRGLLPYQLPNHRIETVGLRSMKVKRMREEKAAQARELWMKAQSAAAGKTKREKKMLESAIKIQAMWRGYLARKRRRYLMGQHLLWRMQRLRDDQIRRKMTYKIARFWGKARLLKSDTNQEIVLKQYPRWWQSTIMDIIRPTVGWHEGAKMVREQEFFAKKTKRKGRWRVHVARARVGVALVRVGMATRKQRGREKRHARAVETYRNVRARGGVSAEQKEDLQQVSRKAKHAVKKQAEERQKAEEALKSARDALEALIGPFRLRNAVNGALKRGMLMPFPVSVQRGKAAAKLERGQKMREVLKWMPHGRRVRMEPRDLSSEEPPAAGPRSRPPPHALGPFFVLGVKEWQQKDAKPATSASFVVAAFSGVPSPKTEPAAENKGTGTEGAAAVGHDSGDSAKEAPATVEAASSCPLLVLDRQWLLAEAPSCQAFAMPILPVPHQVLTAVGTGLRDSFLVQGTIKAVVVAAHVHHHRLERWQTYFDDDSLIHNRLGRWAERSEAFSQSLMLRRRKLFDVEKGFDEERRKVVEAIEYVVNLWTSLQENLDVAKSAAATGLAAKQGDNGKGLIGGKLARKVVVQLFKKWVQSDDKTKVIIMHRSGKAANDPAIEVVQAVGYIKIDLDTPTPVLREFIRRFCGGWLNEHAKGDRFVMENSTGGLVSRSKEGGKFVATAMDMVQERINKNTRDTEAVVFVQDERSREDPDADVIPVLIPEKDLLDPESMPTFDEDDDVDGQGDGNDVDGDSAKAAREKRKTNTGEEGGEDGDKDESDMSSEHFSASIGSMGSDLEEHEDDPFAAMEKDLAAEKEEEEKKMAKEKPSTAEG